METAHLEDIAALRGWIGKKLAVSEWKDVIQEDIEQFGRDTGDNCWIHTDQMRSSSSSPYGNAIGQGLLSLCFLTSFAKDVLNRTEMCICVDYGFNRVRFPAPVTAGQRIRAHLTIASIEKLVAGGKVTWTGVVEIENSEKPACYAEIVLQYFLH